MTQQLEWSEKPSSSTQPATRDQNGVRPGGTVHRATWIGLAAYAIQRLAVGVLILAAISYLTFLGLNLAEGADFGAAAAQSLEEWLAYGANLLQGTLGDTLPGTVAPRPVPVSEVLGPIVAKSVGLLGVSMIIASAVGIILGLWAARKRYSSISLLVLIASIIGVSIPSFFAALLLQLLMVRIVRTTGGPPPLPIGGFGWDDHIILPALVLAARPVAQITRMTSIAVGDILDEDFIRTARGKGLWPRQVWGRHILRNAAIPILTTIGLSLRFCLSSLPVVELFFGWPGLGYTLLRSISRQDQYMTVAIILSLGVIVILVNLLLDLAYRGLDPRLRESVRRVTRQGSKPRLAKRLANSIESAWEFLVHNPIRGWLQSRKRPSEPSPFSQVLADNGNQLQLDEAKYAQERRRAWWRGTLGNLPFVLGLILVGGLLLVVFLGPRLAPHSPYTTRGLTIIDGNFLMPPFDPGETYPWGTDVLGRDIMSLVLAGAQQTLLLAALVVAARLIVGAVLGAVAGWVSGSWFDRAVLGAAEIIAAFPTLVLAMIVILALGIREGMKPFVIALCFVGWGEIMQYVRGEVMAIRPKPFVESAVAVGLRSSRILITQILPILVSALISIVALEMGAVLMLLGELGFISIFIGGGAFAELDIGGQIYHYSDVPEWGSLLSSVRQYARSYPWVAIYPALAFFIAIVGFNLFGEGLRRMVETVGVGLNRLFNRYTFAIAVVAILGIGWARSNTGALAFYRQQASLFSGQSAYAHTETLADARFQQRSMGTQGVEQAADWIADQFEALGLQAGGEEFTYFQNRWRSFQKLVSVPELDPGGSAADAEFEPVYRQDFVEYPGIYRNGGRASGAVHVILAGPLNQGSYLSRYPALREVVEPEDIVLVLSTRVARYVEEVPRAGMLVVAENDEDLRRSYTLSARETWGLETTPSLLISEEMADRLLADTGQTVAGLRDQEAALADNEVGHFLMDRAVSLNVDSVTEERVPVRNVIGHLPGAAGRAQAGEAQMDNQLVVVLTQYDSPPAGPDGCCLATNDSASGVGVMLEAIRTIQESGYQPYRTFLFIAYAGEGLDGGEPVNPLDVNKFLQAKAGFATVFEVEALVHLRALGAGEGDRLLMSAGGNQRLASLFETSARRMGVDMVRQDEGVDLSIIFEERTAQQRSAQEAPYVALRWEGWEPTARTAADTLDAISPDKLEQAGGSLVLALMVMGREERY